MATTLRHRRGSTSSHNSFTGASGEITVDTSKNVAVVHNGSTVGGFEMLREDMSNLNIGGTNSAGRVIQSDGDGTYSFTSLTLGKVRQVKTLDFSTMYYDNTGSINTFQDVTGFSLAITPSSTSSRILVGVHLGFVGSFSIGFRILRNGTAIGVANNSGVFNGGFKGGASNIHGQSVGFTTPDSPSTTGSVTYKLQAAFYNTTYGIAINRSISAQNTTTHYGNYRSNMILTEIGP